MIVLTVPMLRMGRSETARVPWDAGMFRVLVIASMAASIPLAVKHGTGDLPLPAVSYPSILFAAGGERREGPMPLAPAMLATSVLIAALQVSTCGLPPRRRCRLDPLSRN